MRCIIVCTSKREEVFYIPDDRDADAECEILVNAVQESVTADECRMIEIRGVGKYAMIWSNEIETITLVDLEVQSVLDAKADQLFDDASQSTPSRYN